LNIIEEVMMVFPCVGSAAGIVVDDARNTAARMGAAARVGLMSILIGFSSKETSIELVCSIALAREF
jgi:hypothetical protein